MCDLVLNMVVLVTCKNGDLIKNEGATVVTRKCVTDGRRLHGYTISSPYEPSAKVN